MPLPFSCEHWAASWFGLSPSHYTVNWICIIITSSFFLNSMARLSPYVMTPPATCREEGAPPQPPWPPTRGPREPVEHDGPRAGEGAPHAHLEHGPGRESFT
jgi:hypothetical protein